MSRSPMLEGGSFHFYPRKEHIMSFQDEHLRRRAVKAIALQEQGFFLIDRRRELPLLGCNPDDLRFSRERDGRGRCYDYENAWGKFQFAPEDYGLLVLCKGAPPQELLPQPKLEVATATVHTGFATIHNNGKSFDLDLETRDKVDFGTLKLLNQTLAEEELPVVVWQVDEGESDTPPIIRITNDSAMLFASSATWSPDDQQLVATQVVTTSQELLKAIKASLATNNRKSYITVKTPEDSAYLKGARRGFITATNSLTQANAEGTVSALLHPLSGDPQAHTDDHFYLVITPEEDLSEKFVERLDLAIPWPLQPEWAEYLLEAGKRAGLVEELPTVGTDFSAGLKVLKNETKWQQVISTGLKQGRISIS
jgi:hypothetical protein